MAMTLSQATLTGKIGWTATQTVTGFQSRKQGPDSLIGSITLNLSTINVLHAKRYTIANGATENIDLQALANIVGETGVVLTKIQGLLISSVGATPMPFSVEPGAANGILWPLAAVGDKINIQAGGFLCVGDGATFTVDATHKVIKVVNTGGSSSDFDVAILGGT